MTRFLIAGAFTSVNDLWEFIVDNFFSTELPYYENFTIQSNALFSIRWVIVGLTIGIIFAAISTVYNKRYLGDFIRLLIYTDSLDASRAKTLSEFGCARSVGIRSSIKSGGHLERWVRCAEEDQFYAALEQQRTEHEELHKDEKHPPKFREPTFKRDCKTMHFYIPAELKESAEIKFDAKGANWLGVIIVSGIAIAVCLLSCYFLPDVLTYVDNFLSIINGL